MKSTDINEKVLDVYGQLPLDWLTPEDIWWNTLRKILNDKPRNFDKSKSATVTLLCTSQNIDIEKGLEQTRHGAPDCPAHHSRKQSGPPGEFPDDP